MKRRLLIFAIAFALWIALVAGMWVLGSRQARVKTEWMLDYAVLDVHDTVFGAIDTMLGHVAHIATRSLGKPSPVPIAEMEKLAKELDIDELNAVTREGTIVASNDPRNPGVIMAGDAVMGAFMELTNGVTATVSQPFRPNVRNPAVRAKYLAAAFPGGNGFVQVGLDEVRLKRMLPAILGYIFDEWLLGEMGFFLCADATTGELISNPSRHRNQAHSLKEAGYAFDKAKSHEVVADGKTAGDTFEQHLFGEKCYCRAFLFGGHRFVAALPAREYFGPHMVLVSVFGAVIFLVLGAFALFLDRIFRDADRLKAFHRAEDERRAKDMEMAKSIQKSAIPRTFPPFPEIRAVSIFASMHAAREVGGDFYDFYFTGPTKIVFLVADVSGKGVPAALFMMRAKASIKGIAQTGKPIADVVTEANSALSIDNDASMFVTAWVGEIDISTGTVTYVNAGHNPPLLIPEWRSGDPSVRYLRSKPCLALGVMPGVKYRSDTLALSPGDAIYLYTDGITEQPDASNAMFGEERLKNTIAGMLENNTPLFDGKGVSPMLGAIFACVRAHGGTVDQADDCTQLLVRYNGSRQSHSFPPSKEGISAASEWLDGVLADVGEAAGDPRLGAQLHVVLDEIASNIANHSGATFFDVEFTPPLPPDAESPAGRTVKIAFADDGAPYDPLAHADPDVTLPADERPIGGLGIMIVKKMASSVSYRRLRNRNIFEVSLALKR